MLESDSDSDEGPGPGAYYKASQTAFNPGQRPERLQFFGSTVERFADNSTKMKPGAEIGPGYYEAKTGATSAGFGV